MAINGPSTGAPRRSLMAAVLALPAVALPAAAPAKGGHGGPPLSTDAEAAFIRDCNEWMAWEVEFHRVEGPWGHTMDPQPPALVEYLAEVMDIQQEIYDRIEGYRPKTLAGFAALAQLAIQDFAPLADGTVSPGDNHDAWRMFRAMGARYIAEYLREERWHEVVPMADAPPPMSALARAYVDAIAAEPGQRTSAAAMERARAAQLAALA